jgi:GNAT superfamily N-acetyltransferase
MTLRIVAKDKISDADETAIREALRAHNRESSGFSGPWGELVLCLEDEAGVTKGGLTARYGYQWMFIELLIVPKDARGQDLGTELMQQAEQVARDNSLVGIWLDTFAFQARGFYEKLGYSVIGTLPDYPPGHTLYWLAKRIEANPLEKGNA